MRKIAAVVILVRQFAYEYIFHVSPETSKSNTITAYSKVERGTQATNRIQLHLKLELLIVGTYSLCQAGRQPIRWLTHTHC